MKQFHFISGIVIVIGRYGHKSLIWIFVYIWSSSCSRSNFKWHTKQGGTLLRTLKIADDKTHLLRNTSQLTSSKWRIIKQISINILNAHLEMIVLKYLYISTVTLKRRKKDHHSFKASFHKKNPIVEVYKGKQLLITKMQKKSVH